MYLVVIEGKFNAVDDILGDHCFDSFDLGSTTIGKRPIAVGSRDRRTTDATYTRCGILSNG